MGEARPLPLAVEQEQKELLPRALSHSSIRTYLECPQKWKLKYVDALPEKPRYFFSFGKSMHAALEFLYDVKVLPAPGFEDLLKFYYAHWIGEGYASAVQEEQYRAEGARILQGYYRKNVPSLRVPLFVEYEFRTKVDAGTRRDFSVDIGRQRREVSIEPQYLKPVPLLGYIDRIDKADDGALDIVDYKTGKAFDLERVRSDRQLTMYQMACEQLLGMRVRSLTLYHLPSQSALSVPRREESEVLALRETVAAVAGLIRRGMAKLRESGEESGVQLGLALGREPAAAQAPGAEADSVPEEFKPCPEDAKCGWCDFKAYCPAWRHLFAKSAPEERAPALRSEAQLARLVDQFGKLKDEIRSLEARAEDVRKEIADQLRAKGYVRAFGDAYEVGLHDEEKWEFADRQKVLDVIQRAGYWDRIVAPLPSLVQKLMSDPNLPLDLRERLARLGHRTRHGVLRVKKIEQED